MSFFDLFKRPDINAGVEAWRAEPKAVLLDVRTPEEYRQGHIEGSVNLPLDALRAAREKLPATDTPLFVHCLSGARSAQAVSILRTMGYTQVTNIGGLNGYRGKVVK